MRLGPRTLAVLSILLLATLASPSAAQAPQPGGLLLGLGDEATGRLVPGVYADLLDGQGFGRLDVGDVRDVDVSPDGRAIAVARTDGLFLRSLSDGTEVRLGAEPASVEWAPDSLSVIATGFFGEDWQVRRVRLDGTSDVLATSPAITDAYARQDGVVLALRRFVSGAVHTVELRPGEAPVTVRTFAIPRLAVAPDGEWFVRPENATSGIVVERFDGAASRTLDETPGRRPVAFGPAGRIAWTKEGTWGVLNGPPGPFPGTLRLVAWEGNGARMAALLEPAGDAGSLQLVLLPLTAGGTPAVQSTLDSASPRALAWPSFSAAPPLLRGVPLPSAPPIANRVAFVVAGGIRTAGFDGSDRTSAHASSIPVRALRAGPDGTLVFADERGLWRVFWDGRDAPVQLHEGPVLDFDVSVAGGTAEYLLEVPGSAGSEIHLLREGVLTRQVAGAAPAFLAPGWAKYHTGAERSSTRLLDLTSGATHALSTGPVPQGAFQMRAGLHAASSTGRLWLAEHGPAWTGPFGERLVAASSGGTPLGLSPDGTKLVFSRQDGENATVLLASLSPTSPLVTRVLLSGLRAAHEAVFLDEGTLLLVTDGESGRSVARHTLSNDARAVWPGANADARLVTPFAAPPGQGGQTPTRDVALGQQGDEPVRGVVRLSSGRPGSGSYSWSASSQGRETALGSAPADTGVAWDTGRERNGWYVVEARDENGVVVESATVLVQNPREPGELAVATAAGVGLTVGFSWLWGQMATLLGAVKSWVAQSVEEVLQNRTRKRGTLAVRARRFATSLGLVLAAGTVLGLASTFAVAAVPRFVWPEFLEMLPYVVGSVIIFYAIHQMVEHAVAVWLGSDAEFNLWGAGTATLLFSSAAFAMPFGVPGYMDAPPHPDRRAEGRRALGTVLGLIAAITPFALLAWWRFDVYEAGAGTALGIGVSLLAPVSTLPGAMLWKWTRLGWMGTTLAALAVFWCYELALGGPLAFAAVGVVAAAGLAATVLWRRGGTVAV